MPFIIAVIFFLFFGNAAFAQQPDYQKTYLEFPKVKTAVPSVITEDWKVRLQHIPDVLTADSKINDKGDAAPVPVKLKNSNSRSVNTSPRTPSILESFEVHLTDFGSPNDNDIAINNDGILVTVINQNVNVIDTKTDSLLLNTSLKGFVNQPTFIGSFDPKVIYDHEADRFIFIYLLGGLSAANSEMVVAFSQSNDPTGAWNVYNLEGNPLNDNSWSDFPVVALTQDDLIITIGLSFNGVSDSIGINQGIIWQIDKNSGYGDSAMLSTTVWSGIEAGGDHFDFMLPIQGGDALAGPDVYVIANRTYDIQNDTFWLVEITGNQKDVSSTLSVRPLLTGTPYGNPPDGFQPDTSELATNGAFMLGGFVENGEIHFVGNTTDFNTGKPAIYHGTHHLGFDVVLGEVISDPNLDFAYPNISYVGNNKKYGAIICFNHTSLDTFPGMSVIHWDWDDGYSERKTVVNGTSIVNVLPPSITERWGDYTGNQRVYNEDGACWVAGYFATTRNTSDIGSSWVAKIQDDAVVYASVEEPGVLTKSDHKVYPNPSSDNMVFVEFEMAKQTDLEIVLFDQQGKEVKKIWKGVIKQGNNQIQFTTEYLEPGIYYLKGIKGQRNTFTTRLVIQ